MFPTAVQLKTRPTLVLRTPRTRRRSAPYRFFEYKELPKPMEPKKVEDIVVVNQVNQIFDQLQYAPVQDPQPDAQVENNEWKVVLLLVFLAIYTLCSLCYHAHNILRLLCKEDTLCTLSFHIFDIVRILRNGNWTLVEGDSDD
ncbi:hypothetical protein L218DRAFT_585962 [Marasmius fiardii PR-910]|nr:hypothetical protein L218DRAFT_585962 [Marasmius fiardii PR-910]